MKSLKDYSMRLSEQAYHEYPAWSYSKIARYARNGFESLESLDDSVKQTDDMRFGSLVDSLLTRGFTATNDAYVVLSGSTPPPAIKAVLEKLLDGSHANYVDIDDGDFQEAFDACEYQPRQKFETKKRAMDDYSDYFNARNSGKEVVSQEDWDDALTMAKTIKTDKFLSTLFGSKNTEGIDYLYQVQFISKNISGVPEGTPVKCMFDLLVVNHNDKTIQPVDLKTSSMPAYEFAEHFVKMRYDIQAAVYTDVLSDIIANNQEYSDYTILPFLFTDISRTDKVPVTFSYDVASQPDGFSFQNYTYKNWKALLNEIMEYRENNAVVPSYIRTDRPNDLISLLNRNNNNE